MLGYVKKELLEAAEVATSIERDARIKAETRAEAAELALRDARDDNRRLLETIESLALSNNETVEKQAEMYKDSQATLLNHVAPIDETKLYGDPDDPALKRMTPEEILAEPASTKQGMILRARRAAEAAERLKSEEQRKEEQRRRDLIVSQEEQRINLSDFDPNLGILVEKAATEPLTVEAN